MIYAANWVGLIEVPLGANVIPKGAALGYSAIIRRRQPASLVIGELTAFACIIRRRAKFSSSEANPSDFRKNAVYEAHEPQTATHRTSKPA